MKLKSRKEKRELLTRLDSVTLFVVTRFFVLSQKVFSSPSQRPLQLVVAIQFVVNTTRLIMMMLRRSLKASTRCLAWKSTPCRSFSSVLEEPRESMPFDVLIVGGGPAGLAASIRLRQLCAEHDKDLSVCVMDKGR